MVNELLRYYAEEPQVDNALLRRVAKAPPRLNRLPSTDTRRISYGDPNADRMRNALVPERWKGVDEARGLVRNYLATGQAPQMSDEEKRQMLQTALTNVDIPLAGITSYHGSPTSGIRKWDMNFRGTGEGRLPADSPMRESFKDMIAHGLYSAENAGIAKGYQERLGGSEAKYWADRAKKLDADIAMWKDSPQYDANGEMLANTIRLRDEAVEKAAKIGSTYETELLPHPDEFLLWDRPLSEQPKGVRDALTGVIAKLDEVGLRYEALRAEKYPKSIPWSELSNSEKLLHAQRSDIGLPNHEYQTIKFMQEFPQRKETGGDILYKDLASRIGSQKAASDYLESLGIKGVKYLDNPSRGRGEGTYNYVTFRPETEAIITHENGQRIPGAVEDAYRRVRDPESRRRLLERFPELGQ